MPQAGMVILHCIWLAATARHTIAAAASGPLHGDRDASWVHCWEHGHTREDCCEHPSQNQVRACFDSVFTRNECCSGDWARLFPTAVGEAPLWEDAAQWARPVSGSLEAAASPWRSRTRHPSFRREQRQWEAAMHNASVVLEEEVLGQRLRLHVFKRSGPALDAVLKELGEDLYRLRHVPVPPAAEFMLPLVVVDIGASVGAVAVLMAKLWPEVHVVAVEPAPANFRYLLWNIRINGVSQRVWPINVAVGSASSAAQAFYYSPTYPTWSQASHDEESLREPGDESWRGGWTDWQVRFETPVVTLAELLAALGLPELHLLKVDCEGCEWGVFAPLAWARLRHRVRHVAAELHRWALRADEDEGQVLEAAVRESICLHEFHRENTLCSTM